jgi:hypothetical protein
MKPQAIQETGRAGALSDCQHELKISRRKEITRTLQSSKVPEEVGPGKLARRLASLSAPAPWFFF